MRTIFTLRSVLLITLFFLQQQVTAAPTAGDYRSNVSPTGLWSDASSWQTFNGTAWVAAVSAPTYSNGVITVVAGDSIRINNAVTIDQVVIESGAALIMTNAIFGTTFTLNNGAGTDLQNAGHLYISSNATLSGGGNIVNDSDGYFVIKNLGVLGVNTINNGLINVSGTATLQNVTLTNNKTFVLVNFTLNINSAAFVNNDSVTIPSNTDASFTGSGTSTFTNNTTGVIYRSGLLGAANFNGTLAFANSGSITGNGTYNIANITANTGTISTGNAAGILGVPHTFIHNKPAVVKLSLRSNGAVAGTDYDQLQITSLLTNTSITDLTLNVTDLSMDPAGTIYTLITAPLGSITGSFASIQLPPTLDNLTYNINSVTVRKTAFSILPLIWGNVAAAAVNGGVALHWNTLQEQGTAAFIIERSYNGAAFKKIGEVNATGRAGGSSYAFIDADAVYNTIGYYRLKQVAANGMPLYSSVVHIKLLAGSTPVVTAIVSPVKDVLTVNADANNIFVNITDAAGRLMLKQPLQQGTNSFNTSKWSTGTYNVTLLQAGKFLQVQRIVKI